MMKKEELRVFLILLMCSDPWPVSDKGSLKAMEELADRESQAHGFSDRIAALLEPDTRLRVTSRCTFCDGVKGNLHCPVCVGSAKMIRKPTMKELVGLAEQMYQALWDIDHPIAYMRRALKDGEQLNGFFANALAKDAEYLKTIAAKALYLKSGMKVTIEEA